MLLEPNPFENIVGKYFECQDEPPHGDSQCPALSMYMGGLVLNDVSGMWTCPLCYMSVGSEPDETDQMFDDDEDEGDAFEEVTQFVAEGADKLFVTFTDEQQAVVSRLTKIEEAIFKIGYINTKFAKYLETNQYYIVQEVRAKEISGEPLFQTKLLMPKILAVALHRYQGTVPDTHLKVLTNSPRSVRMIVKTLKTLEDNQDSNPLAEKIYYVGNSVGISNPILSVMFQQFERKGSPPNAVADQTTRAAAWIYLQARIANIKGITKTKLKSVPGVRSNALDRAVDSYQVFLANGNIQAEIVMETDD